MPLSHSPAPKRESRMKSIGKVEIPQDVFTKILRNES